MMSWLAEQRIQEAMRSGAFDHLPGHGKPLNLEDLSGVPEELRMSFKIMKNAGVLPEELILRKECVTLEEMLAACRNEGGAASGAMKELETKLSLKRFRLQQLLQERGVEGGGFGAYEEAVRRKLLGEE
ncbi:protein of unknown function [Paenibacillus sp. NFR01]|nr:protein of unknown function [Paenibacillus sp. NFR01]